MTTIVFSVLAQELASCAQEQTKIPQVFALAG